MYKSLEDWDNEWTSSFDHYQQDTRHAYYVNAIIGDLSNILEIAAGSFRDMNKLNEMGRNCFGIDFSDVSIKKAQLQFPNYKSKIIKANAFKMPFDDDEFDVSYHNGFWGYFDNEKIQELLQEQIRVTKKMIIASVHNRHCQQFFDYFERKKETDPLFDIRFFSKDEMIALFSPHCKEVKVIPIGKQKKFFEDDLINIGLFDANSLRKSFDYHKENLIDCSERLMVVGLL